MTEAVLAETQGGTVPVYPDTAERALAPRGAWFPVRLSPVNGTSLEPVWYAHPVRGQVVLKATPESLAVRMFRRVASVLIREAGF
ncbi:hypothetical protein [Salaquimonas pukyongi]|uniref:hypothetical protein n=1 Tax=Salaquimonas pukyongi TaxID=2712698 RepID=UPI0009FA4B8C|nr:hypothetical protein [Salaquimonas pukyongi]